MIEMEDMNVVEVGMHNMKGIMEYLKDTKK